MTLYRQGKVPGSFYDGCGQEAVTVGAAFAMAAARPAVHPAPRPRRASGPRRGAGRGSSRQYMGRAGGVTRGREGNIHFGDPALGCVGMVSMLPDMMVVATGMAMAFQLRGEQRCALTFFGDGSTSRGDFHEAMNWAGLQRLPVIFVLENNQYAYSTPIERQFAVDPVERAAGYGIAGESRRRQRRRGGVRRRSARARERALAGDGPTLIEAVTMRMHGHAAHDDMRYVPDELLEDVGAARPDRPPAARVARARHRRRRAREEVEPRSRPPPRRRCASPMPDPATATDGVFAERGRRRSATAGRRWSGFRSGCDARTMTYLQAISDGLREEMRADERVLRDGRGHRRLRRRLQGHRRLHRRVRREAGAGHADRRGRRSSGTAVGAAVGGLRPVCEMQFADFVACGFDQLVNVAGKMHYRLGLAVPMTVRLPTGGGFSGGPFHSQNPEAWFMHAPGLKVVAPSHRARTPRAC